MRLLFISTTFPHPWARWRGAFNDALVSTWAGQHDVNVISPLPWTSWVRQAARRFFFRSKRSQDPTATGTSQPPFRVEHPVYVYPPACRRASHGYWYWQSIRHAAARIANDGPLDLVIGYWTHPDGEAALQVARHYRTRSALIVGGSDILVLTSGAARRRRIVATLRAVDSVIAVSEHLRQRMIELGVDRHRISVVRRGVDYAVFSAADRNLERSRLSIPRDVSLVLWAGRMVPVKRLDLVLAAAKVLQRATQKAFRFVLVGDGPVRHRLEADTQRLGLGSMVRFLGNVDRPTLARWFQAADTTLLASDSEGIPNVLLESIACGTPFVATAVGGVPEIADPNLDRLVPPGDAVSLAAAIEDICQRREVVQRGYVPDDISVAAIRTLQACLGNTSSSFTTEAHSTAIRGNRAIRPESIHS